MLTKHRLIKLATCERETIIILPVFHMYARETLYRKSNDFYYLPLDLLICRLFTKFSIYFVGEKNVHLV